MTFLRKGILVDRTENIFTALAVPQVPDGRLSAVKRRAVPLQRFNQTDKSAGVVTSGSLLTLVSRG